MKTYTGGGCLGRRRRYSEDGTYVWKWVPEPSRRLMRFQQAIMARVNSECQPRTDENGTNCLGCPGPCRIALYGTTFPAARLGVGLISGITGLSGLFV